MAEYIEKKATIADLNKTYDAMSAFHPQFYAGYQFAVNRLRAFPTADVAPVRHGHWVTTDTPLGQCCVCSVCGSCPTMEYKYCPYCGSLMNGGTDNEM